MMDDAAFIEQSRIIANLQQRLDAAQRDTAQAIIALVLAAGGRIEVLASDLEAVPHFTLMAHEFKQTGTTIYQVHRKSPKRKSEF